MSACFAHRGDFTVPTFFDRWMRMDEAKVLFNFANIDCFTCMLCVVRRSRCHGVVYAACFAVFCRTWETFARRHSHRSRLNQHTYLLGHTCTSRVTKYFSIIKVIVVYSSLFWTVTRTYIHTTKTRYLAKTQHINNASADAFSPILHKPT